MGGPSEGGVPDRGEFNGNQRHLREHTEPLAREYEATISLWLARIEGTDQLPTEHDTVDQEFNEPNDYHDEAHSKE